jgi:twinkle protein
MNYQEPADIAESFETSVPSEPNTDLCSPAWLASQVEQLYKTGIPRGVSPGWPQLAQLWTLKPGEWTLVTGIPSHGKSGFMNAVMVNTAKRDGWKWLIWSAESMPHELHIADLLEQYIGLPFNEGPTPRMSAKQLERGMDWLTEHFRFIAPPEEEESVERMVRAAETSSPWHQGLCIDPWNELNHDFEGRKISETEYISRSLKRIRRYASRSQVHVVIVAHPKMLAKDKDGKYPIPTPYDVAGSAHWRNKADCALTVWRDESKLGESTIFVQKIRRKSVGRIGGVELKFDVVTGRYYEWGAE